MADDVFREALEIFARLVQFRLRLLHLLAMLVDVEERNPADAHLQQLLHVRVHEVANELLLERLEAVINRGDDGFVRLAFLDLLVNALLDEDAFQRAVMQFVEQLLLAQIQFALEDGDELLRVFAQHFADTVSSTGRLFLMTTMRLEIVTSQSVNA